MHINMYIVLLSPATERTPYLKYPQALTVKMVIAELTAKIQLLLNLHPIIIQKVPLF
jgi:hypothetical protein